MKKKRILLAFVILLALFGLLKWIVLAPADKNTRLKLSLLKQELIEKGYHPRWFVISGKRGRLYNSLLSNSAKNSNHLQGKAIDVYVIDINADGAFNRLDINALIKANASVEKAHPELRGALGFYRKKKWPSNRMLHVDTGGNQKTFGL